MLDVSRNILYCIGKSDSSNVASYCNDPKFSDRYAWVYTVFHSVCIVWTHYSIVEPHNSNFRVIRTNFLGVRIFRKFKVYEDTVDKNHCSYD